MQSPTLFTTSGLVDDQRAITVDELADRAIVDCGGCVLVGLVDVLAAAHLRVDADLLVVAFEDGSSRAVRTAPVTAADDVYVQLTAVHRRADDAVQWVARLWSARCGASSEVRSISATTFAEFVRWR